MGGWGGYDGQKQAGTGNNKCVKKLNACHSHLIYILHILTILFLPSFPFTVGHIRSRVGASSDAMEKLFNFPARSRAN